VAEVQLEAVAFVVEHDVDLLHLELLLTAVNQLFEVGQEIDEGLGQHVQHFRVSFDGKSFTLIVQFLKVEIAYFLKSCLFICLSF